MDADLTLLDDRIRGVPPGTRALPLEAVGEQGWHPAAGVMTLPVLTLDEEAFASNRELMLRYAREHGASIAAHAKTPMAPALAASLVKAGAWGTTVADTRQAAVMLRAGLSRLIMANEVGGRGGARRLAVLLDTWPEADVYLFADSPEAVAALAGAVGKGTRRPLPVLVEVGAGRAGARDRQAGLAVIEAIAGAAGLRLAGVAAYEGAAVRSTPEASLLAVDAVLDLAADIFGAVRERVGADVPLVLTAGGTAFFDRVVAKLGPLTTPDGRTELVLRSGSIFFNDHGVYERALGSIDGRQGFVLDGAPIAAATRFRPVLRLWAEVLSRPEPGLAICGMGMRDVSYDIDLPRPLTIFRDGAALPSTGARLPMKTVKLNDQHAFLELGAGADLAVGDVVEFGVSHPCTCLHLHRVVFGVDGTGHVRRAYPTFFG